MRTQLRLSGLARRACCCRTLAADGVEAVVLDSLSGLGARRRSPSPRTRRGPSTRAK